MALPLAYFISWTCYGQRLHGDERGSVDKQHNSLGTPLLPPDAERREFEQSRMIGGRVTLNDAMRTVVDRSITSLCEDRRWKCLAWNARTTHVHVVVNCRGECSPERVMAQFKARATRDLRRAALVTSDSRLWTEHGSTRWINFEAGLFGAIGYVENWQSGPNREMLEVHKKIVRQRLAEMTAWLQANELPADGRTVVIGESEEERRRRVATWGSGEGL